jgi:hypothetical protein
MNWTCHGPRENKANLGGSSQWTVDSAQGREPRRGRVAQNEPNWGRRRISQDSSILLFSKAVRGTHPTSLGGLGYLGDGLRGTFCAKQSQFHGRPDAGQVLSEKRVTTDWTPDMRRNNKANFHRAVARAEPAPTQDCHPCEGRGGGMPGRPMAARGGATQGRSRLIVVHILAW